MNSNTNASLQQSFAARWRSPALITDEISLTYEALYCKAAALHAWLLAQGCATGDCIAIRLPNCWQFAVAYLAGIIGGHPFVPVNPELSQADQSYIVGRTRPRLVLDDPTLIAGLQAADCTGPVFDKPSDRLGAIFFTSGTTGRPKGVCHTLDALAGNVIAFNRAHGLNEQTRLYHTMPMAYMAGFLNTLLSPWLAGGTVLLGPRFTPANALDYWRRPLALQANTLWLTPTMASVLARICRDPDTAGRVGSSLRQVFCGTAPLPLRTRQTFRQTFSIPLQESYGMSEILLVAAQTVQEATEEKHVGQLLPGIRLSERPIPELGDTEIIVHTPWHLAGYLMEDSEESPLLGDGGMPTGDLGRLIDGKLHITGRIKDLIIRGGLNVSPTQVEDVLLQEPDVVEAAVIGLPHDLWGEIITACLVAREPDDTQQLQARLQTRCQEALMEGMRPDRYIWLPSLPKATTGKVQKFTLREQLA